MIIPVSGNLSECERERVQRNLQLLNFKIQCGGFGQPENWEGIVRVCCMQLLSHFATGHVLDFEDIRDTQCVSP